MLAACTVVKEEIPLDKYDNAIVQLDYKLNTDLQDTSLVFYYFIYLDSVKLKSVTPNAVVLSSNPIFKLPFSNLKAGFFFQSKLFNADRTIVYESDIKFIKSVVDEWSNKCIIGKGQSLPTKLRNTICSLVKIEVGDWARFWNVDFDHVSNSIYPDVYLKLNNVAITGINENIDRPYPNITLTEPIPIETNVENTLQFVDFNFNIIPDRVIFSKKFTMGKYQFSKFKLKGNALVDSIYDYGYNTNSCKLLFNLK